MLVSPFTFALLVYFLQCLLLTSVRAKLRLRHRNLAQHPVYWDELPASLVFDFCPLAVQTVWLKACVQPLAGEGDGTGTWFLAGWLESSSLSVMWPYHVLKGMCLKKKEKQQCHYAGQRWDLIYDVSYHSTDQAVVDVGDGSRDDVGFVM